jgi:small subunit ribosomal protein S6
MRFLTTALDKHAIVYNERRRKGEFRNKENRKPKKAEEGASK